jgi:hypothetical protein
VAWEMRQEDVKSVALGSDTFSPRICSIGDWLNPGMQTTEEISKDSAQHLLTGAPK